MLSDALRVRSSIRALALVAYLSFPILMGVKEGLSEGFLPALLWPVPVFLAVILLGCIPFWAGAFGDSWLLATWIVQAGLVVAVGRLAGTDRSSVKRAAGATWAFLALINIMLWIVLGPHDV